MGKIVGRGIRLIEEGGWFVGVFLAFIASGIIYFSYWYFTGRWESKGKCNICKGTGTVGRWNNRARPCAHCWGTGKSDPAKRWWTGKTDSERGVQVST